MRRVPEDFPVQGTFAEKLDYLCRVIHPSDRGPYTLEELGRAFDVSPQYVHALRRGTKTKPTIEVVQRIADFFGIPSGAFFNDRPQEAQQAADEVAAFIALRDAGIRQVALRLTGRTPEEREEILGLVDHVRQMQDARRERSRRGRSGQGAPDTGPDDESDE